MGPVHASPVGSEWHRWEPHIHAPGTLFNDHFDGWDQYLAGIEAASPRIEALAITDYYCIRTYRKALTYKAAGRLPDVKLLFPNVEMRLTIETERRKGINIHLLFSPSDPDHPEQIERVLGLLTFETDRSRYACRLDDLARLGRELDPGQTDEEAAIRCGANQFKVTLDQLRNLFKAEKWLRENALVAVAGAEQDGTAGLQADASFAATREKIERFADIIFSGKTSTRDFWLGQKPGFDRAAIESRFDYLKPCLHGCDAHRDDQIAAPDMNRFCWVKSDLTFDGLRQAVIEPAERVFIGAAAPASSDASSRLSSVAVTGAPWFKAGTVPLSPGLVAIIGARGSGKTALADIIASGARALGADSDASFVHRASDPVDLLAGVSVQESWQDGTVTNEALREPDPIFDEEVAPRVRYLSQQFVERLCSKEGLGAELVKEIESVIFSATDEIDRLGAASFEALKEARLEPLMTEKRSCLQAIQDASRRIADEDALWDSLGNEKKKLAALEERAATGLKELEKLVPKGNEDRAKRLAELEKACGDAERAIQTLRLQKQKLEELAGEVRRVREREAPRRLDEMKRQYQAANLAPDEWALFLPVFAGDVDALLTACIARVDSAIDARLRADSGTADPSTFDSGTALPALRAACDAAKKAVGVDAEKEKRFRDLKTQLGAWEAEKKALSARIAHIEAAPERRKEQTELRREAYQGAFDTLVRGQKLLEELYAPLMARLREIDSSAKLGCAVARLVDVGAWVRRGEQLLDFRTAFRGGSLKRAAELELLPAWSSGTAAEVEAARKAFLANHMKEILACEPRSPPEAVAQWRQDVAGWLFSVEHVSLRYSLRYDGIDIRQLSPGTRGIVLLTLYLAIDEWDLRPLVVDQPEENLDPKSVFAELVEFFRMARQRRQVILVTHNANLVVNTDADQVIVASAVRSKSEGLPDISYCSGSLENKVIRDKVCELLEGGEKAFLERERRYRLRWGDRDFRAS